MKKFLTVAFLFITSGSFLFSVSTGANERNAIEISKKYWEQFYKDTDEIMQPTAFAQFCLPLISKAHPLLEMGCGDGRDTLYFSSQGIEVYACDLSQTTIEKLQKIGQSHFFTGDFTNLGDSLRRQKIGTIYSRFTLHSINAASASKVFQWSFEKLEEGGALMLEVRTVNDPLYGKGEQVEKDAFFTDHYRRFIRKDEIVKELEQIGFSVTYAVESTGFAKYKNDSPPVLRVIARK